MSLQVSSEHNAQCENQGFVNRGCSGTSYMAVLQQLGVYGLCTGAVNYIPADGIAKQEADA